MTLRQSAGTRDLVFISGMDGHARLFRQFEQAIVRSGYGVLYVEHYELELLKVTDFVVLADMVRARMDEAGVGSAVICGESFGGPIAQCFARKYPERTAALILLATFAHLNYRRRAWLATQFGWGLMLLSRLVPRHCIRLGRYLYNPLLVPTDPQELRNSVNHWPALPTWAYLSRAIQAVLFDSRSWLPGITKPTLICAGDDDRLIPPLCSEEMARLLPNSTLRMIGGGGT